MIASWQFLNRLKPAEFIFITIAVLNSCEHNGSSFSELKVLEHSFYNVPRRAREKIISIRS